MKHKASCAVYDPCPSTCDCGAPTDYQRGFQAGAASRDAYIEQLELALLQVRKAICGDIHNTDDLLDLIASRDAEIQRLQFALSDTEALECGNAEKCDQLRAQINVLREAMGLLEKYVSYNGDTWVQKEARNALATTPEQSLAEYRNKVIEECAAKCKDKHVNGNWMYDYREECEAAILDMKEKP